MLCDALRGYPHMTGAASGTPCRRPCGRRAAHAILRPAGGGRAHRLRDGRGGALRAAGVHRDEVDDPARGADGAGYLATVLAEAAPYHGATLETRAADYTPPCASGSRWAATCWREDYCARGGGAASSRRGRRALLGPARAGPAHAAHRRPAARRPTVSIAGAAESVRNVTLRLTQLFDLTGHPAVSLPCGRGGARTAGGRAVGRSPRRPASCCASRAPASACGPGAGPEAGRADGVLRSPACSPRSSTSGSGGSPPSRPTASSAPFEWGLDWLRRSTRHADPDAAAEVVAADASATATRSSTTAPAAALRRHRRRAPDFESAVRTPHPANNVVTAASSPARCARREGRAHRAVVVLPQWNSDAEGHIGLAKLLALRHQRRCGCACPTTTGACRPN